MTTTQSSADEGAVKTSGQPLSIEDFVNLEVARTKSNQDLSKSDQTEDDPQGILGGDKVLDETDEAAENQDEQIEETQGDESENVLSQSNQDKENSESEEINEGNGVSLANLTLDDLDNLSEEEIGELSKTLGSRAVARYGQLTARAKNAEERLAKLEQRLAKENEKSYESSVTNNPLSSLDTFEKLQEKQENVNKAIKELDFLMFKSQNLDVDEVAFEDGGKEYTKADLWQMKENAQKDLDVYIPDQFKKLQAREQSKELKNQFDDAIKREIPWSTDESSNQAQTFQSMVNDPRVIKLKEIADPTVQAQLDYLIAHAVNSMTGSIKPKEKLSKSIKIDPPKQPGGNAGMSGKKESDVDKKIRLAKEKYEKTHSSEDWVTLETLKAQVNY